MVVRHMIHPLRACGSTPYIDDQPQTQRIPTGGCRPTAQPRVCVTKKAGASAGASIEAAGPRRVAALTARGPHTHPYGKSTQRGFA
jgi:hypothetical protein